MNKIKGYTQFVNESRFDSEPNKFSDWNGRDLSIYRTESGSLKFDIDSMGWLYDTEDVAEGAALMVTTKKFKNNTEIKAIEINDIDKKNVNVIDSLFWLSGGVKFWNHESFKSWEDMKPLINDKFNSIVLEMVNKSETLGELMDSFNGESDLIYQIMEFLDENDCLEPDDDDDEQVQESVKNPEKFSKFIFEPETSTIRTIPENYWIATVVNNELVFDSWDGAIKGRVDIKKITKMWKDGEIKSRKNKK